MRRAYDELAVSHGSAYGRARCLFEPPLETREHESETASGRRLLGTSNMLTSDLGRSHEMHAHSRAIEMHLLIAARTLPRQNVPAMRAIAGLICDAVRIQAWHLPVGDPIGDVHTGG